MFYDENAPEEEQRELWKRVEAGWNDTAACQENARLVELDAPEGTRRFDITAPVTVEKVCVECHALRHLCRLIGCYWKNTIWMCPGTSSSRVCGSEAVEATMRAGV